MNKTYHDFKLKSGHRVVMVRSLFHHQFGHQTTPKGNFNHWDSVRMTVSKDEVATSTIIDRKIIKQLRQELLRAIKIIGE